MHPDVVLERTQWDSFWVPPGTTVVDRPELLYFSHLGGNPSLNTVNRLRAPAPALDGLLGEVLGAHQGGPSRLQVTPQNRSPALLAALQRAGYQRGHEHDAFVAPTSAVRPEPAADLSVCRVQTLEDLQTALDVMGRAFGRSDVFDEATKRTWLAQCADPAGRVHRYVVRDERGGALAAAGMTVFPQLHFALFWGGGTVPGARGRGAYSALVSSRLRQACSLGASLAGLYARLETSAPIVAAQGFERHGRMAFWERST